MKKGILRTLKNTLITEFLYQRFFVFRRSIDTNELAQKRRS